jgi:hypothetical protein
VARDLGLEVAAPATPAEPEPRPSPRGRIDLSDIDRYLESLTR